MTEYLIAILFALIVIPVGAETEPVVDGVNSLDADSTGIISDATEAALNPAEVEPVSEANRDATEPDLPVSGANPEQVLLKDVMLVLDNSGSMKNNDPGFLTGKAVKEFISRQDENTRVGMVIFGQSVRLPVALTDVSLANRENILNSIEDINYEGLFTESPAGIERAIYELKNKGREDAIKSIIFMTDGIVDTGDPGQDLEKSKWLREDLASDAADNKIKIFAIAFTDAADFQLIQSIAQKTKGEYYRALKAEDLHNVFEQINTIINIPPAPESVSVPATESVRPVPDARPVAPPAPVIIEVPAQTMGQEERIRSIITIAAVIILTITLLGILILLIRRNRELKDANNVFVQEAYINDLQNKTDKQTHKLGTRPTMFGRIAGKDTDYLDYIVVAESTVGRRHALIEYKDYSFWIIDQGSINGTFVNGKAVNSELRLRHGDRIRLHKCEFEFIMPEMEDSGATVISKTGLVNQPAADNSEEVTRIMGSGDASDEEPAFELNEAASMDDPADETIMLDDGDGVGRGDGADGR